MHLLLPSLAHIPPPLTAYVVCVQAVQHVADYEQGKTDDVVPRVAAATPQMAAALAAEASARVVTGKDVDVDALLDSLDGGGTF
jgi:hypothetical protein